MTLKEIAFQERCLVLGRSEHRLDPLDTLDHSDQVGPVPEIDPVGADTVREVAAAAHVNDAAAAIAKHIHTGFVGE